MSRRILMPIVAGVVAVTSLVPRSLQAQPCTPQWVPGVGQSGLSGPAQATHAFDDSGGMALYVGGSFVTAGGLTVNNVAKWNGTFWSTLSSGTNSVVNALASYNDGGGLRLYAAGAFDDAGGVTVSSIAKWNGAAWSALGGSTNNPIFALAVWGDGLYAGGSYTTVGGVSANRVAKWNGVFWSPLGSGIGFSSVDALAATNETSAIGPALYAGGNFVSAGGNSAFRIAKWNGVTWSALGTGCNAAVTALTIDEVTDRLYVGGKFTDAGGVTANYVAAWNGSSWSALGTGMNDWVLALAMFDDGTGRALYAAGRFTTAGGVSVNRLAKWDGANWSAVGSPTNGTNSDAQALGPANQPLSVGTGNPALFVGGVFTQAGGQAANRIAEWGACTAIPDPGDCDTNGSIDLNDHAAVVDCMTGPGGGVPANCDCADLDEDNDVDLEDWSDFQLLIPG